MSEPARITGVFFEPARTFADIAERPRWIVPLLLIVLASLVFSTMIGRRIGFERIVQEQIDKSPQAAQMSAEQRQQSVAVGTKIASISAYAGVIVGVPVYYLLAAAILLGITAGIMSAPVRYKQVFAIMCYAGLPGIIYAALGIVVMFLKSPDQFNMQNPLAFNPGAFMDPANTSKFVYSLASSMDLFSFWTMFLIATGLKAAAGRKLSMGGAVFAVVLPWAVWILAKAALAGAFGR